MKLHLTLLLVLVCCLAANAQEVEVVRTNTELVQTAVTVLDQKGNFVDGLQREQFELVVDGRARPVAFFERIAAGSARERELASLSNPAATNPPAPARVLGRTI